MKGSVPPILCENWRAVLICKNPGCDLMLEGKLNIGVKKISFPSLGRMVEGQTPECLLLGFFLKNQEYG